MPVKGWLIFSALFRTDEEVTRTFNNSLDWNEVVPITEATPASTSSPKPGSGMMLKKSRTIFLLRHPIGALRSQWQRVGNEVEEASTSDSDYLGERFREFANATITEWRSLVQEVVPGVVEGTAKIVQYEHLREEPISYISEIMTFLNINTPQSGELRQRVECFRVKTKDYKKKKAAAANEKSASSSNRVLKTIKDRTILLFIQDQIRAVNEIVRGATNGAQSVTYKVRMY